MRKKLALTSAALGLIAALPAASVPDSRASQGKGSTGLEGSWEVRVISISNPIPPFDEFFTFTPGGAMIEANNTSPPAASSPGHSTWEPAGNQTYNFTFYKLPFLGPLRVRGTIVLQGRDEWTGPPAAVDFLDPAGNVVLSDQMTAAARRIAALPQ